MDQVSDYNSDYNSVTDDSVTELRYNKLKASRKFSY